LKGDFIIDKLSYMIWWECERGTRLDGLSVILL